jgi:hypothetical protein
LYVVLFCVLLTTFFHIYLSFSSSFPLLFFLPLLCLLPSVCFFLLYFLACLESSLLYHSSGADLRRMRPGLPYVLPQAAADRAASGLVDMPLVCPTPFLEIRHGHLKIFKKYYPLFPDSLSAPSFPSSGMWNASFCSCQVSCQRAAALGHAFPAHGVEPAHAAGSGPSAGPREQGRIGLGLVAHRRAL